jgi:hypothetical protein
MPFIKQSERENPDMESPGSRCFVEYRAIMARWGANPRWTTCDEIAQRLWPNPFERAFALAFMVFFALHVMPYEKHKMWQNGDIK